MALVFLSGVHVLLFPLFSLFIPFFPLCFHLFFLPYPLFGPMSGVDREFAALNYVDPHSLAVRPGGEGATGGVPSYPVRRIAIAGHSYVGRLNLSRTLYQPGNLQVRRFAKPGGTITSFRTSGAWDALVRWRPDLTFLVLGGNDIVDGVCVWTLVGRLADLVLELEEETGGRCHIVGIECRDNPRGISAEDFKRVKNAVNRGLKRVHRIRGRYTNMQFYHEYLSWDGVHLDNRGTEQLLRHLLAETRRHFHIIQG